MGKYANPATKAGFRNGPRRGLAPLLTLLFEFEQRTCVIGECCRVEDLDAGLVVAGERGNRIGAACLRGIGRRIEPNPNVIYLHGRDLRACC